MGRAPSEATQQLYTVATSSPGGGYGGMDMGVCVGGVGECANYRWWGEREGGGGGGWGGGWGVGGEGGGGRGVGVEIESPPNRGRSWRTSISLERLVTYLY